MSDVVIKVLQEEAKEIDEAITAKQAFANSLKRDLRNLYADIDSLTIKLQRVQEGIHVLKTIKDLTPEGY